MALHKKQFSTKASTRPVDKNRIRFLETNQTGAEISFAFLNSSQGLKSSVPGPVIREAVRGRSSVAQLAHPQLRLGRMEHDILSIVMYTISLDNSE